MFRTLSPLGFIVAILALWRITHLLWGEDGPGSIFVRLRGAAGQGFWGGLLDCFYCLSLWLAAPLAWMIGETWLDRLLLWFGLSGGAILLERVTTPKATAPPPAIWHQETHPSKANQEENDHVLLR